jgi:ATP:ADP antiporter, AAA family
VTPPPDDDEPHATADAATADAAAAASGDDPADERRATAWACAYHFMLLSSYYILRPLRDAMGLQGKVKSLPWLFAATLAATALCAPILAALAARLPRRRLLAVIHHALAAQLLIFFGALAARSPWPARVFFVWTSVFNLFAVSVFWSFMADRFTPAEATRRYGLIAVGGTLGAIVGAAITGSLVDAVGMRPLLLVAAVLLEGALVCARLVDRRRRVGTSIVARSTAARAMPPSTSRGATLVFIRHLARSPYLAALAAYLLLYTLTSTFAYFEQARIVSAAISDERARAALFARIDAWVNVTSLVLQVGLTATLLRRAGVARTLAILPVTTLAGFVAILVRPSLAVLIVFQVVRRAVDYACARPARELCFTVLAREDKYASKSFIDTFVYRGGDMLGAAASGAVGGAAAWCALPVCVAWLAVALFTGARQSRLARAC